MSDKPCIHEKCKISRYVTVMLPSGQPAQMRLDDEQYNKIITEMEKGHQRVTDFLNHASSIIEPYLDAYNAEEYFSDYNSKSYGVSINDDEDINVQYLTIDIKVIDDEIELSIDLDVDEDDILQIKDDDNQHCADGWPTPRSKNELKVFKRQSYSSHIITDIDGVAHAFHFMMKAMNDDLADVYNNINTTFEVHDKLFMS